MDSRYRWSAERANRWYKSIPWPVGDCQACLQSLLGLEFLRACRSFAQPKGGEGAGRQANDHPVRLAGDGGRADSRGHANDKDGYDGVAAMGLAPWLGFLGQHGPLLSAVGYWAL